MHRHLYMKGFKMKKLIGKGLVFLVAVFFICMGLLYLSAKEPARTVLARWTGSEAFMDTNEMLPYFQRAKEPEDTTKLILGDSICRQMFAELEPYNDDTDILATNAALMMTGQYLLAEEYVENHPETTDIFLVMHPMTLTRTIDTEWSYRYALMTYVETDTFSKLDPNTINAYRQVFGDFLVKKEVVGAIEESPILRKLALSYINTNKENYVQDNSFELADQYVKKLYDLCKEREINFHFYSSPVTEYYYTDISALRVEYEGTWMSSQFPDYLNDIYYYPSEWAEDLSHFSGEYATREKLNEMISKVYGETPLQQIKISK